MELTTTKVRNIIRLNTNLNPSSVHLEGVGFDFWTYNIDDEWIFRFPKHHAVIEALYLERELTRELSLSIPIPRIEFSIARPKGFHLPIVGYPRLPGSSLSVFHCAKVSTSVLSKQLGKVLSEIHSTVQESKKTVSHSYYKPIIKPIIKPFIEVQDFQRLQRNISESELSFVKGVIKQSETLQLSDDQVLVHGDLSAENILVNEALNLTGILDWTNHQLGNRAYDFVGLWMWGGSNFVNAVLEHYEFNLGSVDKSFLPAWGLSTFISRFIRELDEGRGIKEHYLYRLFRDRVQETARLT